METKLEYIITNSYKTEIISYLNAHPEDFEEAIKLAITDKQPYSRRAAWLLWSCMDNNDIRIQNQIEKIVSALPTKKDSHLRDLLLILYRMELDEEFEGAIFNICVNTWEKITKKPSVRFSALKMIVKISNHHPELIKEVKLLTQSQYMDSLSDSARNSILKMTKKLKAI